MRVDSVYRLSIPSMHAQGDRQSTWCADTHRALGVLVGVDKRDVVLVGVKRRVFLRLSYVFLMLQDVYMHSRHLFAASVCGISLDHLYAASVWVITLGYLFVTPEAGGVCPRVGTLN